jgi:phosphatidylglycerol---prolipoprotein diacylglyceryl transferase
MKPYVFANGGIVVSWFMFLLAISLLLGYIYIKLSSKKYEVDKSKAEDIFFVLLIAGFVGARLTYVVLNYDSYSHKLTSMFKISHMNLNFIGGLLIGIIALYIVSVWKKIPFNKLFKLYVIPFYISAAILVWSRFLEGFLVGKEYTGFLAVKYFGEYRHPTVLYISVLFIMGAFIESLELKALSYKYRSYITLGFVMLGYYGILTLFT